MARKHLSRNHTARRGLKVFVALMVGVTLAVLVTQYNTLQQRIRRVNGRLGEDDLSPAGRLPFGEGEMAGGQRGLGWREAPGVGNGITDKFEPVPAREAPSEPAIQPEWEETAVSTIGEPLTIETARAGEFIPTDGAHDCPEDYPIKGNSKSHIYHLPGGGSYNATIPNICFATEEAAQAAGYRATKR
jgi:hypothetical protein